MMSPNQGPRLRSLTVIPARLESTRLTRKLLLAETGKPLVQHTYEAALTAKVPTGVIVATDSDEIATVVRQFRGRVEMTSVHCQSGTDRCAQVAASLRDVDVVVNVQGDEPEIDGDAIDLTVELLDRTPTAAMSTLAVPIRAQERLLDPACVKVVVSSSGRALYFSRAPIPHARHWSDTILETDPPLFFQHVGVYAYRTEFLVQLASTPPSRLELIEGLEQLRALEEVAEIIVGVVNHAHKGIDTLEDYRSFVERWRESLASG